MKYLKWLKKHLDNLNDKTIIITGGNSGIGFSCAKYCAFLNARVILACRSEKRALSAIEKIKEECPLAKVEYIHFDQSSFTSIDTFIVELKEKYGEVDCFVANAGIYHPSVNQKTEQGFSLTMGTNYFGLYYLSLHFKNFIKKNGKVIFITSLTYKKSKLRDRGNISDISKKPIVEYADSKFLVAALYKSLTNEHYFNCYLLHPGISYTNIVSSSQSGFSKVFQSLAKFFMPLLFQSPDKASLGIMLALSDSTKEGSYIVPKGLFEISGYPKNKIEKYLDLNRVNEMMEQSKKIIDEVKINA